jgi:hypothetical protein
MGTVVNQLGTHRTVRFFCEVRCNAWPKSFPFPVQGKKELIISSLFRTEHISNLIPTVEPNPTDPSRPLNHLFQVAMKDLHLSFANLENFLRLGTILSWTTLKDIQTPGKVSCLYQVVNVTMKFHVVDKLKTWKFIVFWGPFALLDVNPLIQLSYPFRVGSSLVEKFSLSSMRFMVSLKSSPVD